MLLAPPLVTAVAVLWAGFFAESSFSPLAWVKIIAQREYGP
jgi:multicomponent Na+:H+ antiporter subunit D